MNKRALRRYHRGRLKKKITEMFSKLRTPEIHIDTPKRCSCPACGNPRKHFGEKTREEKINEIKFQEEIEEELKNE